MKSYFTKLSYIRNLGEMELFQGPLHLRRLEQIQPHQDLKMNDIIKPVNI